MRSSPRGRRAAADEVLAAFIAMQSLKGCYAHELADYDGTPLSRSSTATSRRNSLFITCQGEIKLLDFGIAKATMNVTHTETGVLKGKVRYMAPEQIADRNLDRRADVFALGIVLWEMLAGRGLYRGDVASIVTRMTTDDPPLIRTVRPEVSEELETIVARALRRDISARYPTADAMRADLEQFIRGRQDGADTALARMLNETFKEHDAREDSRADQAIPWPGCPCPPAPEAAPTAEAAGSSRGIAGVRREQPGGAAEWQQWQREWPGLRNPTDRLERSVLRLAARLADRCDAIPFAQIVVVGSGGQAQWSPGHRALRAPRDTPPEDAAAASSPSNAIPVAPVPSARPWFMSRTSPPRRAHRMEERPRLLQTRPISSSPPRRRRSRFSRRMNPRGRHSTSNRSPLRRARSCCASKAEPASSAAIVPTHGTHETHEPARPSGASRAHSQTPVAPATAPAAPSASAARPKIRVVGEDEAP